ncbi:glycosyltransferase [Blautia obeum]|uniref:glycosyltransferase n=1 Tax=Blautia obeum TaxID=40520 RepID=UPI003F892021
MELGTLKISEQKKICTCAFLILNYETYWECFDCVKSIYTSIGKNIIDSGACVIVIVDNGSQNDSLQRIKNKYRSERNIYIIASHTNLGFAKGNNLGFRYIKDNFKAKFICMINSDILITDDDFLSKLVINYENCKFSVAGPNVVLPSGTPLNPMKSNLCDSDTADVAIKNLMLKLKLCDLHIEPLVAAWMRVKNKFTQRNKSLTGVGKTRKLECMAGEQVHGCFIIFSEEYIEKFDGLYDKTFLYGEETLLRLRCTRCKMSMWYLADLHALHNESRTEKYTGGKVNERHKRRYTNMLNSLKVVEEYLADLNEL